MSLVTAAEVLAIMGEEDTVSCDAQIAVADLIVTEQLTGKGLSDALMTTVELYLAAHLTLLSLENGPLAKKMVNTSSEGYHDIYGPGLQSTRFGQTACMLDTSGTLSQMTASVVKPAMTAMFSVVGTQNTDPLW